MSGQQERRDAETQSEISRISIGFKSYETERRYYVPGERSSSVTLERISVPVGDLGEDCARFTLRQDLPGQDPQIFEVGTSEMLKHEEDRRVGAPLSNARAAEIRNCNPDELKIRTKGDSTPASEAAVVKAAYDKILRK
jgi:hypothetical protein